MSNSYTGTAIWLVGLGAFSLPGSLWAATPGDPPSSAAPVLQEIIVTAQKRSESSQSVPIAISNASEEAVRGFAIRDTTDLPALFPSVDLSMKLSSAQPNIRGVGGNAQSPTQESSSSIYLDGVYRPQLLGAIFSLSNIERIEVLKGPQGTLFGRNSAGGVVNIITKTPSTEPSLKATASYSSYETFDATAYVTGGLGDNIAADLSAYYSKQNKGWGRNTALNRDQYKHEYTLLRGKLLWDIADRTRILLTADYSKTISDKGSISRPFDATTRMRASGAELQYTGFYDSPENYGFPSTIKTWSAGLNIDHDLGWSQFTSITSRQSVKAFLFNDNDHTNRIPVPAPNPLAGGIDASIDQSTNTWIQEFRLQSSSDSALKWTVGYYYFHNKGGVHPLQLITGGGVIQRFGTESAESHAGFAESTLAITEGTNITVGGRYSTERRRLVAFSIPASPASTADKSISFNDFSYRIILDQRLAERILAYGSISTGFKSGQFNPISASSPATNPEEVTSYELGLKSELFDRRLRVNLAAFLYDFKDIQLTRVVVGGTQPFNAARANQHGVELDLEAALAPGLTLSGGGSYLHGKYKDFFNSPLTSPAPFPAGGNVVTAGDGSGLTLIHLPKWTFNVGLRYERETEIGTFNFSALYSYNDGFYWDPDNRLREPSFSIVNSSVKWTAPSGKWNATAWVRNLLDEKYNLLAAGTSVVGDFAAPAAPRTMGVTFGIDL